MMRSIVKIYFTKKEAFEFYDISDCLNHKSILDDISSG